MPGPSRRPDPAGDSDASRGEGRSASRLVGLGAWAVLVALIAGAVVGAGAWRDMLESQQQDAFEVTSADVAASMASAVRRDTDFVATLRAAVGTDPDMTNAEFGRWLRVTGATTKYPGGVGFAYVVNVTAQDLPTMAGVLRADPPPTALTTRRFQVVPPGERPVYCLFRLSMSDLPIKLPLGFDSCASGITGYTTDSTARAEGDAGATGQFNIRSLDVTHGLFWIAAPVYRGGDTPRTAAERTRDLLGWVAGTFDGAAILTEGGGARDGLRVEILHRNPGEKEILLAATGRADGPWSRTVSVEAEGTWLIRVSGAVPTTAVPPAVQYWIVLGTGVLVALLLWGFIQVLVRSRRSALRLVERKTEELKHQALHDTLTNLPNRALLADRIEQAMARARRHGTDLALMFIDLDGFKRVNDTFGHRAGDQLLCAVSRRIRGVLEPGDTLGRLGGDEFVVLVEGESLVDGPEAVAERIRDVLAEPVRVGDTQEVTLRVKASIGIATGARDNADQLLRDADIAMYDAKTSGGGGHAVFSPTMQAIVEQSLQLEMDLRGAVEGGELVLAYQPIFDLRSGVITGVEALLRWQHPELGMLLPDAFLPVAEDSGLIVPIGGWVLDEACRQAVTWHRPGRRFTLSVNISARQFSADADLVAQVRAALERSGLEPGLLTLEISEGTLMRDAQASEHRLGRLTALGVRIAIDGFGTGRSSLAHLRQFPVHALKIDRSFFGGLVRSAGSSTLLHALVQLGRALGLETLAEGIEEPAQLEWLRREEFDSGQGFLLARPLSAEALEELIGRVQELPVGGGRGPVDA